MIELKKPKLEPIIARQQADMVIGILERFIPSECRKAARDRLAEVFLIQDARIGADYKDEVQ